MGLNNESKYDQNTMAKFHIQIAGAAGLVKLVKCVQNELFDSVDELTDRLEHVFYKTKHMRNLHEFST